MSSDEASPPPFEIASLALVPDHYQDRLRLNAVDKAGATQAIFLTRRLLDRFVPLLIQRAEKQVDARLPKGLVLSMSQQKLRIERRNPATKPAPIVPGGEPWLCTAMRLSPRKSGAVWNLSGRDGREARFVMTHANMIAMLDVILTKYRAMEWGEDKFPDWTTDNAEDKPRVPAVLH